MFQSKIKLRGLTLVELIVVISVLLVIFAFSFVSFGDVIGRNNLRYYGYQLVQDIRETRTSAIAKKQDSPWGIYFNDTSFPQQYTVFKGIDYASRDPSFDRVQLLPKSVSFERISFGGARDFSFSVSDGMPNRSGVVVLNSDTQEFTISLNNFGLVEYQF